MKKKEGFKEADCVFCGFRHTFDLPRKSFVCEGCGVGQKIEPTLTVRHSVGRNETGHYLPPGTSHR
jgi:hypothetical protein